MSETSDVVQNRKNGNENKRGLDHHANRYTTMKYDEASPWLSFMMYCLLINSFILIFASYASLTGSTKFYPRVFFGLFVVAIPLFLLLGMTFIVVKMKLYRRILWDVCLLLFVGYTSTFFCGTITLRHVFLHGNDSGTTPFEIPGDLGSSTIISHASIIFCSIFVARACSRAILGYSLNAYPLSTLENRT